MCLMFLFIFSESSRAEVGGQRLGGGGGGGGGGGAFRPYPISATVLTL